MTISENKIYPRTGDPQTVYLKNVITNDRITIGDYTIYHDFVYDLREFEKNNVLYHYPVNGDQLKIGKFCSVAVGQSFCLPVQIMQCLHFQPIHFQYFLRNGDWSENKIKKNIAAIQAGRMEALE